MKILLYTGARTGSYEMGKWLETELGIEYFHEPFNTLSTFSVNKYKNFNLNETKNGIIKISPSHDFNYDDNVKLFDKIIVLFRENTQEQSESLIWATHKNQWHYNNVNLHYYYTIDEQFLNDHNDEITKTKKFTDLQNEYLKSLKNCLHIEYEEFFYSNIGIDKLGKYLNFKFQSFPDPITKLRNNKIIKKIL